MNDFEKYVMEFLQCKPAHAMRVAAIVTIHTLMSDGEDGLGYHPVEKPFPTLNTLISLGDKMVKQDYAIYEEHYQRVKLMECRSTNLPLDLVIGNEN